MSVDKSTAILGLVLNIVVLPGIGSILAQQRNIGIIQIFVSLISFPLMYYYIGFITFSMVWIWGIITGVQIINSVNE
ncbi:MAG: hypothetical protein LAT82_03520 [Nanoarchaeota archaeon]|nr:hypothetical protein [Nanoarchaeota archaeon]